jgi:hypothetical protein
MEIGDAMTRDPENANFMDLLPVLADPLYSELRQSIHNQVAFDRRLVGGRLTPVERTVDAETTVDGRRTIVVRQCEEDAPDLKGYQAGVEVDLGSPRNRYEYVVQWVEADAGWRIVTATKVSESC